MRTDRPLLAGFLNALPAALILFALVAYGVWRLAAWLA